ncbi:MAG: hypothetical protein AB7E08_03790 [Candidatus Omnitrophota bacterium]
MKTEEKIKEIFKKYRRLFRLGTPLLIPFFLYLFIYLPFHKRVSVLTKEYKKYHTLMKELGITSLDAEAITNLTKKLSQLEENFFSRDSEAIDTISRLCYRLGLELISISPLKKEKLTDKDKKPLSLGKKNVSRIIFKLSLRTNFINLMRFLEETEKNEKFLLLNNLLINKATPTDVNSDSLKVEIDLEVFVLG